MLKITLAVLALAATTAAWAAEPHKPADWKALAQCAGAYQANAVIRDPSRPSSMKAAIVDQADVYVAAATARNRQMTHASASEAKRAVNVAAEATARRYSGSPRDALDQFIDACPQPDD
jgi:hypothetical protein